MSDAPYTKRELDLKFGVIQDGLQMIDTKIESGFQGVHDRQDTTNGKVKKIIIALIFIGGLTIGLGLDKANLLIGLLQAM